MCLLHIFEHLVLKKGEQAKAWSIVMHNVYFFIRISRRVNFMDFFKLQKTEEFRTWNATCSPENGIVRARAYEDTTENNIDARWGAQWEIAIVLHTQTSNKSNHVNGDILAQQPVQYDNRNHGYCANIYAVLTIISNAHNILSHAIHFFILRQMKMNFDNSSEPFSGRSYWCDVWSICVKFSNFGVKSVSSDLIEVG